MLMDKLRANVDDVRILRAKRDRIRSGLPPPEDYTWWDFQSGPGLNHRYPMAINSVRGPAVMDNQGRSVRTRIITWQWEIRLAGYHVPTEGRDRLWRRYLARVAERANGSHRLTNFEVTGEVIVNVLVNRMVPEGIYFPYVLSIEWQTTCHEVPQRADDEWARSLRPGLPPTRQGFPSAEWQRAAADWLEESDQVASRVAGLPGGRYWARLPMITIGGGSVFVEDRRYPALVSGPLDDLSGVYQQGATILLPDDVAVGVDIEGTPYFRWRPGHNEGATVVRETGDIIEVPPEGVHVARASTAPHEDTIGQWIRSYRAASEESEDTS